LGLYGSNKCGNLYPLILNFTGIHVPARVTSCRRNINRYDLVDGIGTIPGYIEAKEAIKEICFYTCFKTFLSFWQKRTVISSAWQREDRNGTKTSFSKIHIIYT